MLQRFRSVRYIGSCSTCIRKGLPDIHPRRRAVFVGDRRLLNGLADFPGACIDIRCCALDHCDGVIELLWKDVTGRCEEIDNSKGLFLKL
jgi:hypothetical protein